jgi:hypothetical protein
MDVLDACPADGGFELPPISGASYVAFVDPSGGSSDSMTLSIAHRDKFGVFGSDNRSSLLRESAMQDIKVDEALWASNMLPEGIVERWFIADGAIVAAGDPMAEIRIEDALHEIMAPVSGRLTIVAAANTVVEPGSLLARLAVDESSSRG